jgi:hypothetical protein
MMNKSSQSIVRLAFHALSVRERALALLVLASLLLIWMTVLLKDLGAESRNIRFQSETLETFRSTIAQENLASQLLADARAGLDTSRTFSAAQLVGQLDNIAREAELIRFDISSPSTQESEIFSFHTVRLNIKRAELAELIEFDQKIKQFAPYISLSEIQVSANKQDPRYLEATLELVSFELNDDALDG